MVQPISPDNLVRVLRRSKQNDDLGRKISQAIELIQGVLDGMTEDAIALSFNGGKDCTVLLHLFAAVLYARHSQIPDDISLPHPHLIFPSSPHSKTTDSIPDKLDDVQAESSTSRQQRQTEHIVSPTPLPYPPIKSIYITAPNHFEELDSFTEDSVTRYGMDLYRFGGDMKAALTEYLRCGGGKGVKGVLVGTRSGDPNGRVKPLDPTDPHWPQFLRIHPILDWTYAEVWAFLRELDVPYCHLYDEGYTSLGSTKNTIPNPLLRKPDGTYEPAWKLTDGSKERGGRLDASP